MIDSGTRWGQSPTLVKDHDFRSDSIGVAIPYGVYHVVANRGSISVGVSHDTPRFAARSIARWWSRQGNPRYPGAHKLLILADTGGSNAYHTLAWKTQLQLQLCNRFGLTVTVAHYPTGASKWNSIEHRLFSEISKNWTGEPLDSYEKILKFIRSTKTQVCESPPFSTQLITKPDANPTQSKSDSYVFARMTAFQNGTTLSLPRCEFISAWALSSAPPERGSRSSSNLAVGGLSGFGPSAC